MKPKRISMGSYAVEKHGKQIIIYRMGRKGFRIATRPGYASLKFKRLRDAATAALNNLDFLPFTVPMDR